MNDKQEYLELLKKTKERYSIDSFFEFDEIDCVFCERAREIMNKHDHEHNICFYCEVSFPEVFKICNMEYKCDINVLFEDSLKIMDLIDAEIKRVEKEDDN